MMTFSVNSQHKFADHRAMVDLYETSKNKSKVGDYITNNLASSGFIPTDTIIIEDMKTKRDWKQKGKTFIDTDDLQEYELYDSQSATVMATMDIQNTVASNLMAESLVNGFIESEGFEDFIPLWQESREYMLTRIAYYSNQVKSKSSARGWTKLGVNKPEVMAMLKIWAKYIVSIDFDAECYIKTPHKEYNYCLDEQVLELFFLGVDNHINQ